MTALAIALVACALIVSAAYVYAPVARVHAARQLRVPLPAGAVAAAADPIAAPPVELPDSVKRLAALESEPWAQDFVRERARTLYAESGDWQQVVAELERI